MAAKSKKQFRFMKMLEHNPEQMKDKPDMTPEQAKEFTKGNTGKYAFKKLREKVKKKK